VAADADGLVELLDDPLVREWLGPDLAALRGRFTRWESRTSPDGSQRWLNWVVLGERRALGWVQATVRGDRAEVAYAFVPSARGRGHAVTAVRAVVGWLRSEAGAGAVEAHIDPANAASQAVAAAVGLIATDEMDDGEVVWVSPG
jgi:RimJ/RimL family protein N-acetyltransferase